MESARSAIKRMIEDFLLIIQQEQYVVFFAEDVTALSDCSEIALNYS